MIMAKSFLLQLMSPAGPIGDRDPRGTGTSTKTRGLYSYEPVIIHPAEHKDQKRKGEIKPSGLV